MAYRTIQPPFNLKFDQMPKKELREYYAWFQDIMPQRIDELASAVRLSPGFETWRPDYKPDSLNALGHWFAAQVQTRPLTTEEEEEFSALVPNPRKTWELTNRTLSLAMDLGMYLSQVLLRNHSSLQWDQPLGSKRFIDYGQPVLMGFVRKVPFNPVGMMVTFAYGLARKTRTGKGLREIYDIWSRMIDQKPS